MISLLERSASIFSGVYSLVLPLVSVCGTSASLAPQSQAAFLLCSGGPPGVSVPAAFCQLPKSGKIDTRSSFPKSQNAGSPPPCGRSYHLRCLLLTKPSCLGLVWHAGPQRCEKLPPHSLASGNPRHSNFSNSAGHPRQERGKLSPRSHLKSGPMAWGPTCSLRRSCADLGRVLLGYGDFSIVSRVSVEVFWPAYCCSFLLGNEG